MMQRKIHIIIKDQRPGGKREDTKNRKKAFGRIQRLNSAVQYFYIKKDCFLFYRDRMTDR
jgi:hypothetical protein